MQPEIERRILEKAILSRLVEEALLDLFAQGKLSGTVHTCIGQEFTGAVLTEFLSSGDALFSNHRCHGHYLSFTGDVAGLIAEVMGKATGTCGGQGGSQHLCRNGFYSNGIQGSIVPVAAGLAMARQLKQNRHIAAVFIGDGTLGEGAVYETFNLAAKWSLPLLIVLENNLYAQSTHQSETLAGGIEERAAAFGITTRRGDTWDWRELYSIAREAVGFVREEGKPLFLRIDTYRLKAHSKGDDNRARDEVAAFENKDPLTLLLNKPNGEIQNLLEEIKGIVRRATAASETANFPEAPRALASSTAVHWSDYRPQRIRVGNAINNVFRARMKTNPEILFLGEDVKAPYGGAFKISDELSHLFPSQVWNTPISEGAIVGVGTGLALEGFRPVVEIMFGDFIGLAFDPIVNGAAKFADMYNQQVNPHLIIRTPMGGGRGYGPTHSQSLERSFLGTPGLKVLAVNNLIDPALVYEPLLTKSPGAALVIENKLLYTCFLREEMPGGFRIRVSDEEYPTALIQPDSNHIDVNLLAYGGLSETLVQVLETLFVEYDLIAQALVPSQIYPFKISTYKDILSRSRRLVLIEEGQGFAAFGAECLAQLAEDREPEKLPLCRRIMPPARSIPASAPLEKSMLPSVSSIAHDIARWIHG